MTGLQRQGKLLHAQFPGGNMLNGGDSIAAPTAELRKQTQLQESCLAASADVPFSLSAALVKATRISIASAPTPLPG